MSARRGRAWQSEGRSGELWRLFMDLEVSHMWYPEALSASHRHHCTHCVRSRCCTRAAASRPVSATWPCLFCGQDSDPCLERASPADLLPVSCFRWASNGPLSSFQISKMLKHWALAADLSKVTLHSVLTTELGMKTQWHSIQKPFVGKEVILPS